MAANDGRIAIYDMNLNELQALLLTWGEPRFRARQLWGWLYSRLETDSEAMVNLPVALRKRLDEQAILRPFALASELESKDGQTKKVLLSARDGALVEAVLMRYERRNTVCVSTQVGCPIGCAFCATGQNGFERNLSAGEISGQVLHFSRELAAQDALVTNVVFMGMGEPLLNYDAVLKAVSILEDENGLNMGARRFTLSTAGYVPGIERLTAEGTQMGLAISLHAADDTLRSRLVPLNDRYPIGVLVSAVQAFAEKTGRRPTYEYMLIGGLNDGPEHARALVQLLRRTLAHVNLIPLNTTPGFDYPPPTAVAVRAFQDVLVKQGIETTVRLSRGTDILAACGQLRAHHHSDES